MTRGFAIGGFAPGRPRSRTRLRRRQVRRPPRPIVDLADLAPIMASPMPWRVSSTKDSRTTRGSLAKPARRRFPTARPAVFNLARPTRPLRRRNVGPGLANPPAFAGHPHRRRPTLLTRLTRRTLVWTPRRGRWARSSQPAFCRAGSDRSLSSDGRRAAERRWRSRIDPRRRARWRRHSRARFVQRRIDQRDNLPPLQRRRTVARGIAALANALFVFTGRRAAPKWRPLRCPPKRRGDERVAPGCADPSWSCGGWRRTPLRVERREGKQGLKPRPCSGREG